MTILGVFFCKFLELEEKGIELLGLGELSSFFVFGLLFPDLTLQPNA